MAFMRLLEWNEDGKSAQLGSETRSVLRQFSEEFSFVTTDRTVRAIIRHNAIRKLIPKIDDDLKYHSESQRYNVEMRWRMRGIALHDVVMMNISVKSTPLLPCDVITFLWYCCWCTPRNVTRKVQGGREDIIEDCILTAYCVGLPLFQVPFNSSLIISVTSRAETQTHFLPLC